MFLTYVISEVLFYDVFSTYLISGVSFYNVFLTYLIKKWSFPTMFFSKVVILYEFLKVIFQKACVFSSGEPRGTRHTPSRATTVVYYIEVRTLNARRMFREQTGQPQPGLMQRRHGKYCLSAEQQTVGRQEKGRSLPNRCSCHQLPSQTR